MRYPNAAKGIGRIRTAEIPGIAAAVLRIVFEVLSDVHSGGVFPVIPAVILIRLAIPAVKLTGTEME